MKFHKTKGLSTKVELTPHDLHCNDRQYWTPNTIDDKNTNSNHFTEQAQKLCGLTCFLIEKRGQTILFLQESVEDLQDIADDHVVALATEHLWAICVFAHCCWPHAVLFNVQTCIRCNDRNSATCMLGCLFGCLQAVCIISQWCWSWWVYFCYVVGESSCVQNPVYPKPRAAPSSLFSVVNTDTAEWLKHWGH